VTVASIASECSAMDFNTQELRATLAAPPTSGRGRRYTPEVRNQVIAEASCRSLKSLPEHDSIDSSVRGP
jgi:hypothetical protein